MRFLATLACAALCAAVITGCAPAPGVAAMERPLVVAHRGASAYAPENTVPAYELAWEMGADAGEVDVYITADDGIICIHDYTTDRTTGHEGIVFEMTIPELRELDAGSWMGEEWAGTKLPLLEELYETMPPGTPMFVEIKRSDVRAVHRVVEIVDGIGRREDTVIIAFVKAVCEEAVRIAPDIPVLWLLNAPQDEDGNWQPLPLEYVDEAAEAGFAGINVNINGVTRELKEACDAAGITLSVWTVNPEDHIRRMVRLGVHAITTDVPDVARRVVDEETGRAGVELLAQ